MNPRERVVSNIMQTDVTSVKEADVLDIGQLFRLRRLRNIPVLNGTQLVGVVSIGDLLRACIARLQTAAPSARRDLCGVRIGDVMIRDVVTIDHDATLGETAELMKLQEIAFLPMVDDDGRLLGAVTESDLVTATLR